MRIYLHGPDTYRSKRQLRDMVLKFKKDRDPEGFNVVRLDASLSPGEIMGQILATPFLAERRMIVIERLLVSKHTDLMGELKSRIEEGRLPESNVIIFWEAGEALKTKVAKELSAILEKEPFSQHFDQLSGQPLLKWVLTEVSQRGGNMKTDAAQYLVQHLGTDMWSLSSCLDQLIAYKNGEPITKSDAALFIDERADDNIFNLVDAIVGKQPKKVFGMIRQQYKEGEDAQFVLAMLQRQFRILLQIKDALDYGEDSTSSTLATKMGVHPFVVKKSLPLVKRYQRSELESLYRALLDIDIMTKTGGGEQEMLLDFFVGRVSSTSS